MISNVASLEMVLDVIEAKLMSSNFTSLFALLRNNLSPL
jgi:hypothetical protein